MNNLNSRTELCNNVVVPEEDLYLTSHPKKPKHNPRFVAFSLFSDNKKFFFKKLNKTHLSSGTEPSWRRARDSELTLSESDQSSLFSQSDMTPHVTSSIWCLDTPRIHVSPPVSASHPSDQHPIYTTSAVRFNTVKHFISAVKRKRLVIK